MKIKRNKLILLGISVLATIYFCYPYLNKLNIYGHDIEFHLARIQQISIQLSAFKIPALIHTGLANGLGYGTPLFYPEIFLYIPAIMHCIGVETITCYKIFILLITWATFMSMYICTKKITKSKLISIVSTLLYTFSLWRIVDVYTRGALGEILVFIFLPIIIFGCYELLIGDKKKWYILPIGIFGVANSHIISFAFSVGIVIFFIIINLDEIFIEKERIKYILKAVGISILLTLSVILPIVEQRTNNDYKVFTEGTEITEGEITNTDLIPTQVFMNDYKYDRADIVNEKINGQMNFGIGTLLLVLPLFIFITKWKDKEQKKYIMQLFALGVLALIGTTQIFPWKYFRILNIIQFAWRLNMISTLCFSIVGAYTFYYAVNNKKDMMIILSIIIVFMTSNYLGQVSYSDERQTEEEYSDLGLGEYLPSIPINEDEEYVFDINNKQTEYKYEKIRNEITFETTSEKNSKEINIPLIYYKGYQAEIKTKDGTKKLNLSRNENNGLTKLDNEEKLVGKIKIKYKMTIIQKISYIISYFTLISIIIYVIYIKKKEVK